MTDDGQTETQPSNHSPLTSNLGKRTRARRARSSAQGHIIISLMAAGFRAAATSGSRIEIPPTRATWLADFRDQPQRMLMKPLRLRPTPSMAGGIHPLPGAPRFFFDSAKS